MAFVTTPCPAPTLDQIDTFQVFSSDGGLNGEYVCGHLANPMELWCAQPILRDDAYNVLRMWFIPLATVDPLVTDPRTFGIVCYIGGRNYWLKPVSSATYKIEYLYVSTLFPYAVPGRPSPHAFQIVSNGATGTIKNVLTSQYLIANANQAGFFTLSPTLTANGYFNFYWNTGTGPVTPTTPESPNPFFIMACNGKALTASNTAPYLSWATFSPSNPQQSFTFTAVSWPTNPTPALPFVYNLVANLTGPQGNIICFDNNNNIALRTVAGDWERLIVYPGEQGLPEQFGRIKMTGFSFSATLRVITSTNASGDVTLASNLDAESPKDFFYVIPAFDSGNYGAESKISREDPTVAVNETMPSQDTTVAVNETTPNHDLGE